MPENAPGAPMSYLEAQACLEMSATWRISSAYGVGTRSQFW